VRVSRSRRRDPRPDWTRAKSGLQTNQAPYRCERIRCSIPSMTWMASCREMSIDSNRCGTERAEDRAARRTERESQANG
jgi:hypothetical protein